MRSDDHQDRHAEADPAAAAPADPPTLDLDRARIGRAGAWIPLSGVETTLLRRLADARGAPVPSQELRRELLGPAGTDGALRNAVHRLRAKLEPDPANPTWLQSVRGHGYRLRVPSLPARVERSPLHGLEAQLEVVQHALRPGALVTLWGPAGAGKSHLARALAQRADGRVVWMDLRGRSEVELPHSDDAVLVVLDDAEAAVPTLRRALARRRADGPAVLCTSRRVLGVPGELRVTLEPLEPGAAAALFEAQAAAASRQRVHADNAHLAALARTLDHRPGLLALLAERTNLLSVRQLFFRRGQLPSLLRGAQGLPGLDGLLERSWVLLDPDARQAAVSCTVFAARFESAAAARLLGWPQSRTDPALQQLADLALLHTVGDAWRFPEAERQGFALHLGDEREALFDARRRLLSEGGTGPDTDLDLRAVLQESPEMAASLSESLVGCAPALRGRGHGRELLGWLDRALSAEPEPARRDRLILERAETALSLFTAAPGSERELREVVKRDRALAPRALGLLAAGALRSGDREAAARWTTRALELAERQGADQAATAAWAQLALVRRLQGRQEDAVACYAEALLRVEQPLPRALLRLGLGVLHLQRGALDRAEEHAVAALRVLAGAPAPRAAAPGPKAAALTLLAELRGLQGRTDEALTLLDDALSELPPGDLPRRQEIARTRIRLLVGTGQLDEARAALRALRERSPDALRESQQWLHAYDGAVLALAGRRVEARAALDRALGLAMEPDDVMRAVETWRLLLDGGPPPAPTPGGGDLALACRVVAERLRSQERPGS